MTRKSEVAIQCCKKILVNICSVFCRNLICLLLNGLIFFQDSDFLGCGEKEETKEEMSRALVSTSSLRRITRFVLAYLIFFFGLCNVTAHPTGQTRGWLHYNPTYMVTYMKQTHMSKLSTECVCDCFDVYSSY